MVLAIVVHSRCCLTSSCHIVGSAPQEIIGHCTGIAKVNIIYGLAFALSRWIQSNALYNTVSVVIHTLGMVTVRVRYVPSGYFYIPKSQIKTKHNESGPPRRLVSQTIYRCQRKASTFSSVILRP